MKKTLGLICGIIIGAAVVIPYVFASLFYCFWDSTQRCSDGVQLSIVVLAVLVPTIGAVLGYLHELPQVKKITKWTLIVLAVVFVLQFAFGYRAQMVSQARYGGAIENQVTNTDLSNTAIETGNADECAKVKNDQYYQYAQADCYKDVALKNNDLALCNKIISGKVGLNTASDCKDEIYYARALSANDTSQCLNIIDVNQRNFCSTDHRLTASSQQTASTVPTIVSISPATASIGTVVSLSGTAFAGFEGDKYAWIENQAGQAGIVYGDFEAATNERIRFTLADKYCTQDTSYSGNPCPSYITITAGTYNIFVRPWGAQSNKVRLVVTR